MAYCTVDDALAVLRLQAGDVDEARVQSAVDVTATLIDDELGDVVYPFTPAQLELLRQANTDAAVRAYEMVRAPGGYVDVGDPSGFPARLPRDALAGVLSILDAIPHRAGFA